MALIDWDANFEYGIAEIDDQHKKLVEMINDLHTAQAEGKTIKVMMDVIGRLVDYADYHFKTEEQLMDKFNFPDSQDHKKEHGFFTHEVTLFKKKFDSGEFLLPADVAQFLKNWVLRHIIVNDKDLVKYIKAHS